MDEIVRLGLAEDIGSGDVTSQVCVAEERQASGYFLARESMVLAGTEVLGQLYENPVLLHHDGDRLQDGDRIATVQGNARRLLKLN